MQGTGVADRSVGPAVDERAATVPADRRRARLFGVRRALALCAGLLVTSALGLALELVHLSRPAPWVDEAATHTAVARTWAQLWLLSQGADAPLVPYYALVKTLAAPSESLVALRVVSAVAAALAIGLVYLYGARRHGHAFGATAAVALAASAGLGRYAQEARPYALLCLAGALLWVAGDVHGRRPGLVRGPLVALAAAGAVLIHLFGALLLPGLVLAQLAGPGRRVRRTAWTALWCLVGVAPTWGVLQTILAHGQGSDRSRTLSAATVTDTAVALVAGVRTEPAPAIVLAVLALLSLGLIGDRGWRPTLAAAWCWGLTTPLLGVLVVAAHPNTLFARYWIGALPGLALVEALGLVTLVRLGGGRRWRRGAMGVVTRLPAAAAVLVVVVTQWPAQTQVRAADGHGEDVRPLVAQLRAEDAGDDPLVFLSPTNGGLVLDTVDPALARASLSFAVDPTSTEIWPLHVSSGQMRRMIGTRTVVWWLARTETVPAVGTAATLDGTWSGPFASLKTMGFVVQSTTVGDEWVLSRLVRVTTTPARHGEHVGGLPARTADDTTSPRAAASE